MNEARKFGCQHCWPADADTAWEARKGLERRAELIDETHFHVMILACPQCKQRFVSVFKEMIDWKDGDDPQYWTLLPVTRIEADGLCVQGRSLTEGQLNTLGAGRRSLRRDFPKEADEPQNFWGVGLVVGPHG